MVTNAREAEIAALLEFRDEWRQIAIDVDDLHATAASPTTPSLIPLAEKLDLLRVLVGEIIRRADGEIAFAIACAEHGAPPLATTIN